MIELNRGVTGLGPKAVQSKQLEHVLQNSQQIGIMMKRNQRQRIKVETNVNKVGQQRSKNLKWSDNGSKVETEKIILKRVKSTNNTNIPVT